MPKFSSVTPHPLHKKPHWINDYWDPHYLTRTAINLDHIKNKKLILFVGDSYTFGDGVLYKDTFCNVINEEYLSDEFYCINIAYSGNPNSRMLLRLHQWINEFGGQISTIICGFSFIGRRLIINVDENNIPYDEHVYDNITRHQLSCLANFNPSDSTKMIGEKKYNAVVTLNNDAQDIFEFERDLILLKGLSVMYNFNVLWWYWAAHTMHADVIRIITEHTEDRNFKYMPIQTQNVPRIPNDGHFNAEGHKIVAKIIYDYLYSHYGKH